MVMRRVFNHHVCLCVLSTAILAGLALMTSQTKVYAQAQNCKGVVNGGEEDDKSGLIMCDGGPEGSGRGGVLDGDRDIDMNRQSGAAVTITNNTKITIVGPLKVWDSSGGRGKNNNPAIKVDQQGKLTVMNANVGGVKKGMEVSGPSSSVTVLQGTIGVGNGMGPVIEVRDNGRVVLNDGVTVELNGSSTGEVVIENGGTVELGGVQLKDVKMGMKIMGNGTATVRGGGATITVKQGGMGGTGFKMEGSGTADVMELNINGKGEKRTGAEVTNGTLTLNKVTLKDLATGARVTRGTLELNGGSKINVKQGGTGLNVTGSGTVKLEGTEIQVGAGATGVEMKGSADVTLTRVEIKEVAKGITMTGGTLTLNGGSITGSGSGTGINVIMGGDVTVKGGATITGFATGIKMRGSGALKVSGGSIGFTGTYGVMVGESVRATLTDVTITGNGNGGGTGVDVKGQANVTLTRVTMKQVAKGVVMAGNGTLTLDGGSITGSGSGVGINVIMGGDVTVKGGTTINVVAGGTGVSVGDKVQNTTLTGVRIEGSRGSEKGVEVKGGMVTMKQVDISNVGTGVLMEEKVTNASLTDVTIEGAEKGIAMEGKGTFTVSGTTTINFTGSESYDYGVMVGTSVTKANLTGVTIEGSGTGKQSKGVWVKGGMVTMNTVNVSNVGTGIMMEGSGTLTVEKGTTISFMGAYGVMVEKGVTSATLTGVMITGNKSGTGMGIYAEGGNLTVIGGEIKGVKTGISMTGTGGTLTVKEGTRIQFEGNYGVYVGSSVRSTSLTGVMITGNGNNGMGINMTGGSLTVSGGEIKGVKMGINMTGTGTLTVKDRTTITGVKVGIKMMGGSGNVKLERVTISKVKAGIAMMGSGELKVGGGTTIQFEGDGWVWDRSVGIGEED
ncbi:right-handed parallel beta-helix repeat-containing protein [Bartonella schoenbuchensis]|uniref:right-handed parallel beta-helix repeat-containing protein n=1 Tax=Bartonella schoenbuchensis TaxID=165694 RepID=UPI003144DBE2